MQGTVGLCCAQQAKPNHSHMTRQLTERMNGSECKLLVPLCSGELTAGVLGKQVFKSPGVHTATTV